MYFLCLPMQIFQNKSPLQLEYSLLFNWRGIKRGSKFKFKIEIWIRKRIQLKFEGKLKILPSMSRTSGMVLKEHKKMTEWFNGVDIKGSSNGRVDFKYFAQSRSQTLRSLSKLKRIIENLCQFSLVRSSIKSLKNLCKLDRIIAVKSLFRVILVYTIKKVKWRPTHSQGLPLKLIESVAVKGRKYLIPTYGGSAEIGWFRLPHDWDLDGRIGVQVSQWSWEVPLEKSYSLPTHQRCNTVFAWEIEGDSKSYRLFFLFEPIWFKPLFLHFYLFIL